MESMLGRISRHIKEKQLDIPTIIRGFKTFEDWVSSHAVVGSSIEMSASKSNLGGQKGILDTTYSYLKKNGARLGTFDVFDYPPDIRLQVEVTEDSKDGFGVSPVVYLRQHPTAISEFIGPTCSCHYDSLPLPNNGFFLSNSDARVKFTDTNPSGERRGAVVLTKNGETHIATDTEKWLHVRNHYLGIQAMSGTSIYFTDKDKPETTDIFKDTERDHVSYFVDYCDAANRQRLAVMVINTCVPRVVAQASIEYHLESLNAQSYIAAELELVGAGVLIKDFVTGMSNSYTDRQPRADRLDHYMMIRS